MAQEAQQHTVMVVDSDRMSRIALTNILQATGFVPVVAHSAEEALAAAMGSPPDAFVFDIELPDADVYALCRRLREDARFRFTPIILTAAADHEGAALQRAFAAGCDDFLSKPFEPVVVVGRLAGQFQKYEVLQELERVRQNLTRYISPRLRWLIEQHREGDCQLPAQERMVCVLFSDIRGFTALSQTIPPGQLFSTISHQLGVQVDAVYRHRGYVDKFGGDGIMAVFDGESMAVDACRCALEIMQLVEASQQPDEPPMPVGIGIHMGLVVEGNIGSGEHIDYSVIGNTVNLAARLCGYAHSRDIIVSETVRMAASTDPDLQFVEPQQAHIRGLRSPIRLYRLAVPKESRQALAR